MHYKTPEEYWEEVKKDLGYGDNSSENTYENDPESRAARLAEMQVKLDELNKRINATRNQGERVKLWHEIAAIQRSMNRVRRGTLTGSALRQRRDAVVRELVNGLAYINSFNVRPRSSPVSRATITEPGKALGRSFWRSASPPCPIFGRPF